ncbi:MAG: GtrA family protein [Bacilli bacterium]|nr:GtrA family protein [Bacilli bacterium]
MIKENKEEIVRILKYVFSSGTSFVLDLLLFTIFQWIFSNINLSTMLCIFLATIFSRTMSSLYNYFMNSRFVFNNKDIKTIVAYFILVIIQMFMSAFLVSLIERIVSINATIIKFFVDIVIFIINYIVQKTIIFN